MDASFNLPSDRRLQHENKRAFTTMENHDDFYGMEGEEKSVWRAHQEYQEYDEDGNYSQNHHVMSAYAKYGKRDLDKSEEQIYKQQKMAGQVLVATKNNASSKSWTTPTSFSMPQERTQGQSSSHSSSS